MTPETLQQCVDASFSGSMKFPEIVGKLIDDGVEWYSANLVFGITTSYAPAGEPYQVKWRDGGISPIAHLFDGDEVESAIRASQRGKIAYPEFLSRIAAAGVVYYTVHLKGRKALYFGRHGDFHVEPFPAS